MKVRISCQWAKIILVLAYFSLSLGLAACDDHDLVVTIPPSLQAAVRVDVTPDSSVFTWNLTGPAGFACSGAGDTIMGSMARGEYEIAWGPAAGFHSPDPVVESKTVTNGDTITFTGLYSPQPPETLSVLFLGSSYFNYNNLPGMFRALAKSRGKAVIIKSNIPSGKYLDYHTTDPITIGLINFHHWDVVVLQGVGRIVAYPQTAHFDLKQALMTLESMIHANCGDTEIMFCLPWAFEDGMLWTPGGTDDYFEMQKLIYNHTLNYPKLADIVIAPVGWAWYAIMLENPPLHYLFMPDWNHPSMRGSYLTACVIFASIYRESVEGASYLGNIPRSEAEHFQQTASTTVLDNLELWKLD